MCMYKKNMCLIPVILAMLLLANVGLSQAAAPVGSTISLYSTFSGFYVEMDTGRDNALIALSSSTVGTNEEFIVEDAGSGNILLKSVANSMYARADTSEVVNILRAETTSTSDPLAHFEWVDNGDGTICLRNIGVLKYVRVQGVNQYLKATSASAGADTMFTWDVIGPPVADTDAPTPNPATFATAPVAVNSTIITMTATTGSDVTPPVEYYFAETSGNAGGSDSGWQTSAGYSDGGLSPETEYTYTVEMRDGVSPIPNVGSASNPASATTDIGGAAEMPNIVFILADDVGYGDLACYGHPHIRTPELDQLAADGTRFEGFHVTGITCNPSRAGFMTSRHPATFVGETAAQGFSERTTVTELMHKGGYKVGHFGKWHIGPIEKTGTYGIDDLAVLAGSNATTDGRDAILNAAARDFIEENKDVPFYVNVWGHISHSPVDPHDDLVALFNDFTLNRDDYNYGSYWQQYKFDLSQAIIDYWSLPEDLTMGMRNYMADIWALDVQVGLLLDKIDELGLRDNTIVVFSSDQGAAPVWTVEGIISDPLKDPDICKNMLGTGGGWSGGKHTQLEGGVRTPFIIRWPGNVPAGVVNSTSTISGLDWLPTMCSIAGIDIGSTEVEGEDITDILFGATRSPDRALFWKTHVENSPPSMLEGKWKMHGPLIASSNPDELFDLEADPEETIDVLAANPSIAASMSAAMDAWTATLPMSEFDNEPPVTPNSPNASAGTDQEVYDDDDDGAELVTLDGSGSSDPDGYISGYIWRESGQIIGHTDGPTVNLPVGVYTIEVEVTDYAGNTGFDTVIITVNAWESCGNETCDPGEDQCNCPEDCGTPPSTETNCTDGIDEDCDTDVDCADADCTSDPACEIDTVPPAPNPATFASAPAADSDSAISMTATTGSDATVPIEYLFTETSGNPGGTTSPWQTSTSYTDSGLNGSTQYTYTVTMRDALVNTGTASAPANATTDPAPAGDSNWTNGGGDRAWDNAINWSAGVPRSIDKAGIRNDSVSGPIIDTGTTALALNMVVGDFSSTADSVDMTGGSLTVGGWLILGYGVANNATFTISGGTVDTGGNLYTGFNGAGTLDMTGGSITVGSTFGIAQNTGSIGNVSLDGGTISSGSIVMTSDATMDITAGTLIVNGDVTSTINGYIGSGWITGYDGGGTVDVDYDISNAGKTTVTASNVANVNVPDVVGLAQATAESDIVAAGLVVGTVTTAYSGSVPAGDVISQNPTGGSSVASGSSVDIEVSLGVEMVAVPDVVGQAQATAESDIVAAGLVVGTVTTAYSGSVPAGDVISQDPVGSTSVEIGSSVDLVVSTGPAPAVPAAPSGLSATAITITRIDLSWTDNATDETGFKIERSKRVNTAFAQIDTVGQDVTSYIDTTVRKGTLYYYRVRATNASGDSAYSNEADATTPR